MVIINPRYILLCTRYIEMIVINLVYYHHFSLLLIERQINTPTECLYNVDKGPQAKRYQVDHQYLQRTTTDLLLEKGRTSLGSVDLVEVCVSGKNSKTL